MKKRFYIFGFLSLLAFDTLAQLSFKYAAIHALPLQANLDWLLRVFSMPWIYGAFIGYLGAFFSWMTLLKHAPIGPAFAASHLEILSVMLLSALLFNEKIGWPQILSALLIMVGVICLACSESDIHPQAEASDGLAVRS
ncbi:4-amino-4-deoxy-L-arabinose-phosphoundecaprenol flippase subunit ArnF [compost metagenome]